MRAGEGELQADAAASGWRGGKAEKKSIDNLK